MKSIESQQFWSKLNSGFKGDVNVFFQKYSVVNFWNKVYWASLIISLCTITYFIKMLSDNNFSTNSLLASAFPLMFIVLIEKLMKNPKKDLAKVKQSVRDKMIIKVCNCTEYCTCKEEFVSFMKSNKINILKS